MKNLNSLSDSQLVDGVKNGNNGEDCLKELVSRHSGIYVSMVNNYSPSRSSSLPSCKDELINDKNYYIYQAALKYDNTRNTKFSTYLGNETRWLCLNIYNKQKKSKEFCSHDLANISPPCPDLHEHSIDSEMLSKIISMIDNEPDSRISKIFKMRYIDGEKNKVMPWNKVCRRIGLSIQGCINIHNKTIIKLKKQLKNEL